VTTHPDSRAGEARSRALRTWEAAVGRLLKLPRPTHDHTLTRDLRIPTRDNAVLLADHVAPVGESRGTVLVRSPYGFPAGLRALVGGVFAGHGYHVVLARTRGTFGSGGSFDPFRTEVEDGADTVAWLRDQEWFGGRFATFGGSYLGFTQWALLMDPPPEMVTAIIQVGPHDGSRALHRGGAFNLDDYLGWSDSVAHQGDGSFLRAQLRMATQARRQRPVSEGLPLVDAADRLTGGRARWFRDWVTHRDLTDPYWSPVQLSAALDRTNVPVLLQSGWQDLFLNQTLEQYAHLHERGVEVGLTVGPWTHSQIALKGGPVLYREAVDWLAEHVAGDDGPARSAPVRIQMTGSGEWRDLPAWPPPSTRRVLHPQPGGGLADSPAPAPAQAGFTYDPAEPTPTVGGPFLRNGSAGYQDDTALAARTDVLTFTGPPLTEPLEVIGVPSVDIAHHSDNPHADLFVRVSEVDRKGRSRNVSDGFIRLDPAAPDDDVRVELDAVAHRFATGSCIRLVIAGGSFPRFERNLGTDEDPATGTSMKASHRTIDLAGTRLALHVVP
jgi:hypothetical protein